MNRNIITITNTQTDKIKLHPINLFQKISYQILSYIYIFTKLLILSQVQGRREEERARGKFGPAPIGFLSSTVTV